MEEWLLGLEQGWALGQGLIPLVNTQGLGKSEGPLSRNLLVLATSFLLAHLETFRSVNKSFFPNTLCICFY